MIVCSRFNVPWIVGVALNPFSCWLQTLPYDLLSNELDIQNVRELEDFVINDCMYTVSFKNTRHFSSPLLEPEWVTVQQCHRRLPHCTFS
jgi:hypothetical protein